MKTRNRPAFHGVARGSIITAIGIAEDHPPPLMLAPSRLTRSASGESQSDAFNRLGGDRHVIVLQFFKDDCAVEVKQRVIGKVRECVVENGQRVIAARFHLT